MLCTATRIVEVDHVTGQSDSERKQLVQAPPRALLAALVRTLALTGALFVAYLLAPLQIRTDAQAWPRLLVCISIVVVVVGVQILKVARSPYPLLRAGEAVATSLPLLIFAFASTYVAMSHASPGSFSEALSRTDAAYFATTVFTTVGFGDIVATSGPARLAVTAQMIVNLVVIGVITKVLVGTVQHRRAALDSDS